MNFNQKPGIYDAKTDELIMGFEEAREKKIMYVDEGETKSTLMFLKVVR